MCRRNNELTHSVLLPMLSPLWTSLDLTGCVALKASSLLVALPKLPQLRSLDLTGCRVTNYVLQAIPVCCPDLEVLRLGGAPVCETHRHVWAGLLPACAEDGDADGEGCLDDWESHGAAQLPGRCDFP